MEKLRNLFLVLISFYLINASHAVDINLPSNKQAQQVVNDLNSVVSIVSFPFSGTDKPLNIDLLNPSPINMSKAKGLSDLVDESVERINTINLNLNKELEIKNFILKNQFKEIELAEKKLSQTNSKLLNKIKTNNKGGWRTKYKKYV